MVVEAQLVQPAEVLYVRNAFHVASHVSVVHEISDHLLVLQSVDRRHVTGDLDCKGF